MLYGRAVSEIERLRMELGASDMALEAARSEAARLRITCGNRFDERGNGMAGAGSFGGYEPMSRPVPGTMQARPGGAEGDAGGPPGGRGAAPLVRTVVVGEPRSMIDLFA